MRTTISIPDDLARLARNEARRRGLSLSAIVRQSLEQHLLKRPEEKLPWQGIVSDSSSSARELDATLSRNWSSDIVGDR